MCCATPRQPAGIGVIFLDLDRFTAVNNSVGHGAGDLVLAQAARRVRAIVPVQDTVARWGSDEFAVLVENAGGAAELSELAERLVGAISAERVSRPRRELGAGSPDPAARARRGSPDPARAARASLPRRGAGLPTPPRARSGAGLPTPPRVLGGGSPDPAQPVFSFQYKGLFPAIEEAGRVSFVYRFKLQGMVDDVPCAALHGSAAPRRRRGCTVPGVNTRTDQPMAAGPDPGILQRPRLWMRMNGISPATWCARSAIA